MNLNFFKKIKIEHKIRKERLDIKADIYWRFILLIFFLLTLTSFLFGYYQFTNINRENKLLNEAKIQKVIPISKERLDFVLDYFLNRLEKSKSIIINPAPAIDPSI